MPPPSNISTGAIGGGGGGVPSPPPKYKAPEYDNNERIYSERDSSRKSQGINLKLIIIPIIAIAIIGLIVAVSYLNGLSPTEENKQTIITPPSPDTTQSYKFIKAWESNGTGNGQFNNPSGISVDSSNDSVYVADSFNNRIQKFDSNGNFITEWGNNGTENGQFNFPFSISLDSSSGYMYVSDGFNNRIQKFDSNGNFITKWGNNGTGDGEFKTPRWHCY